MGIIDLHF
jgi:cytochrome c oxidase assembly protein subunit 20